LKGKRGNLLALALVPGAGLVAVGLFLLRMHFQPPTVPAFAIARPVDTLALDGLPLTAGQQFALEVHPTGPVRGAIAARGFLLRGDEIRPWSVPFSVDVDGTVRIDGPVDALFAGVPAGAWDVAVVIGRPETLPTTPNDVLRAAHATEDLPDLSWRLVRERVFLRT
jgi:hypothetical protein